ncbi:hypothetical protein F9278_43625 [Streptomyces phaeolivaceus]|uniref:Uncharacterized protein n=2 Tax=Streptomyces phaeolivaceus TaxID=2653200 RepID=A0A5P8KF13_9ACTN|nr:hypothetical protein F9278_43625 [Streptomyces phaeolivaceus]
MSTTPDVVLERTEAAESSARTADEVNAEIRALWFRSGGTLNREQRSEYERLVLEWAAAS